MLQINSAGDLSLFGSVLAGFMAFAFSTAFITISEEIPPQAYFLRNALPLLSSVLKFYRLVLFSVVRSCAQVPGHVDGAGALNFPNIDKVRVTEEGEPVDAGSIIRLPAKVDLPLITKVSLYVSEPSPQQVNASGHH